MDMSYLSYLNKDSSRQALTAKKKIAVAIANCLKERFGDYNKPILKAMKWFDPINWLADKTYGLPEIKELYTHFKATLDAAQFNAQKVVKEWINFRSYVSTSLPKHSAVELWAEIFQLKRAEYRNLCLLAELTITISGSNSSVERAFSMLRRMLSDQRLSTSHKTLNMRMSIKMNDALWSKQERGMVMERALEIFFEKRRAKELQTLDQTAPTGEPLSKIGMSRLIGK